MGTFVITKSNADGQFYFALKAGNQEKILSSEGYTTKASCISGTDAVRVNAKDDSRYVKATASDGRYYFTLTAVNGQTIGTSQMYEGSSGRETGIASVKANAPDAAVDDQA